MTYRFGVFEFDGHLAVLTRSDRPVALEPQPAKALALLLSRAGEVVSRDDLRAHLWGAETHVDFDRGIAYCLGQLRTALGDNADNPRFVQTLPRRGFRFIAPVEQVRPADLDVPTAEPSAEPSAPSPAGRWSPAAIVAIAARRAGHRRCGRMDRCAGTDLDTADRCRRGLR